MVDDGILVMFQIPGGFWKIKEALIIKQKCYVTLCHYCLQTVCIYVYIERDMNGHEVVLSRTVEVGALRALCF